jgi:hypothetical protein
LPRNDAEFPAHLVDALIAGDLAELARHGDPLAVVGQLMRAALCAKPGHALVCVDFATIESRVLAWYAGETWKLDAFRKYDATGDERLHPYRQIAAQMLRKSVDDIRQAERQMGKSAELACGFAGKVGAWRKIAGDDGRTDAEVEAIIRQWRAAHPMTRMFWSRLARAAHTAIRTKKPTLVAPAPRPPIVAAFDGRDLTLTLPSGRAINYPGARLVPNRKFEDGNPDIEFMDNARGQWKLARAWHGTLVENVAQGTARDLLAAALLRFAAHGLSIVGHCHDEITVEVPQGAVDAREVLALLLESPAWAAGLPLGGKVHSGPLYLEALATVAPPQVVIPSAKSPAAPSNIAPSSTVPPSIEPSWKEFPSVTASGNGGAPPEIGHHVEAARQRNPRARNSPMILTKRSIPTMPHNRTKRKLCARCR